MAELVLQDGIDVLVDLSGHTTGDRLLAFARKPAPVQVSWLGYFNTTGMEAMDYLLVDSIVCPSEGRSSFIEQPFRVEGCYLSYRPFEPVPDVAPPPVLKSGLITYGCFNNPIKLNRAVIRLWARILEAQPDARLMMLGSGYGAGCQDILMQFAEHGIEASRLGFLPPCSHQELLRSYALIDPPAS